MCTLKDNSRRITFEGASFYIDIQSDEMMGGKTAHVHACSVDDHRTLMGGIGGANDPDAPEKAGDPLRDELLETVEQKHYASPDRTVYHGIAGPSDKQRLRPADRWMEWLGIEGKYTPLSYSITKLLIRDPRTFEMYEEPSIDHRTVERILQSAAQLLSQDHQNVHAEMDLAKQLAQYARGADDVEEYITDALSHLADRLEARHNGHDIGVGAIDARGPTGGDWWEVAQ